MGIVSAFTLIRAISLFHITAGYFFLVSPRTMVEQNMVILLGESMHLPHIESITKPTEATALIALLLIFLGISDLFASTLPPLTSLEYWSSAVPIRLLVFFSTSAYVFLFHDEGPLGAGAGAWVAKAGQAQTPGDLIKNSMVFTAGFVEVCAWFWVFVQLREDRREMAVQLNERRQAEENML